MIESDCTLKDLLMPEGQASRDAARSKVDASQAAASLRDSLSKQARNIRWEMVGDTLVDKLAELLDVKVVDLLVSAWQKYGVLAEYADPGRHPPEEAALVPLAEHTIESEHHPSLEILLDNRPVGKFTFDVTLALTLRGFLLRIQNARIKAIQTGTCQGRVSIALEKATLYEKEFEELQLPGTIHLGEGVSLPRRAAAA